MESDKRCGNKKLLMDQCFNFTAPAKENRCWYNVIFEFIFGKHLMTNVIKNF